MADREDDVDALQQVGVSESPATWENEMVGKAKELLGRAIGAEDLAEEGKDQDEIAHHVRDEYRRDHI